MQLFNTLTRKLENFEPSCDNTVKLYTCGPTVYSDLQLGNWTAYIRWDILVRTLKASSYRVNWVMNITDVGHLVSDDDYGEDKMEKGARSEGKTAWEVAEKYTNSFLEGISDLNITSPNHLVKATDHIKEQIDLIKILEQKGFTYLIDDGVYFNTSKFPKYGEFAKLKTDELLAGARINFNQQKLNISDFALWKFTPNDQRRDMEWHSPWGRGFPGWHVECSAMAIKYLGETLDIHCGGIDHIPVHHTNEIAQSEAATGQLFSLFWLHSNFLTVDGTKLSKSLGNSYSLTDLKLKGFSPMDFRMLVLQSHYRTEANFTWEALVAASKRLKRWRNNALLRFQPISDITPVTNISTENILKFLQNNLNSPEALAEIDKILGSFENGISTKQVAEFENLLKVIDELLGLDLFTQPDISLTQKEILSQRQIARNNKNWAKSDELRDLLKAHHIEVRDTNNDQLWSRD